MNQTTEEYRKVFFPEVYCPILIDIPEITKIKKYIEIIKQKRDKTTKARFDELFESLKCTIFTRLFESIERGETRCSINLPLKGDEYETLQVLLKILLSKKYNMENYKESVDGISFEFVNT